MACQAASLMDSRGDSFVVLFLAAVALFIAVVIGGTTDLDDTKQRIPLTTTPLPVMVEP